MIDKDCSDFFLFNMKDKVHDSAGRLFSYLNSPSDFHKLAFSLYENALSFSCINCSWAAAVQVLCHFGGKFFL